MKAYFVAIILVLVLVAGCAKRAAEQPLPQPAKPTAQPPAKPVVQPPPAGEQVTTDAVSDVSAQISDAEIISQDLNDKEVDKIDQDLANIDW